jgi:hypothetical protein
MIVCPLRVSPAVHSLSALPFPVLSRYRPQEKQVFLPMALWFCSMTWFKLPSYMFFRRSFSRSVYLRSYLCYLLLWDLSSVSGWSFLLFGLLTWSLEGYIATWFFLIGTQQDLSRFLLPTVSADCCCDRRWWLCALIPKMIQDSRGAFLPSRLTLKTLRCSRLFEWFVRCWVVVCFFQVWWCHHAPLPTLPRRFDNTVWFLFMDWIGMVVRTVAVVRYRQVFALEVFAAGRMDGPDLYIILPASLRVRRRATSSVTTLFLCFAS